MAQMDALTEANLSEVGAFNREDLRDNLKRRIGRKERSKEGKTLFTRSKLISAALLMAVVALAATGMCVGACACRPGNR